MIPKIIHQLWIGPKPAPTKFMDTWKDKHEEDGFEYIRWTETEMEKRGFRSQLMDKVNSIEEINGKADIIRWEILYEYGGFFTDADSYCLESISKLVEKYEAFAGYENEQVRCPGWCPTPEYDDVMARTHALIATGTMAFPPKHELPRRAIEWIRNNDVSTAKTDKRAWRTVGPGLLTRLYWQDKWDDITILPSHYFLPIHFSGLKYDGPDKIYAFQEWGSTKRNYEEMNFIQIPEEYRPPDDKVSILVSSYNTLTRYVVECLDSIKNQTGKIEKEIIWINDGSDEMHTKILKGLLEKFEMSTKYVRVKYYENDGNKGIGFSLKRGINLCSNEIIIKQDSDDIMMPDRIEKQYNFMKKQEQIAICGGQVAMFRENRNEIFNTSNHSIITWEQYKKNPSHWFVNHPTVCYRKSKVIEAGNYNPDIKVMTEDFDLELRMLKKYGMIFNFKEALIYYRIHTDQVTYNPSQEWIERRNKMINDLINE